jgi:hypothetical protein
VFRPSTVRSKRDTEVEVRERYVQSILGEEHLRPERELGLHGLRTSCAYSLRKPSSPTGRDRSSEIHRRATEADQVGHPGETEPTVSNGSGSARRLGATVA